MPPLKGRNRCCGGNAVRRDVEKMARRYWRVAFRVLIAIPTTLVWAIPMWCMTILFTMQAFPWPNRLPEYRVATWSFDGGRFWWPFVPIELHVLVSPRGRTNQKGRRSKAECKYEPVSHETDETLN